VSERENSEYLEKLEEERNQKKALQEKLDLEEARFAEAQRIVSEIEVEKERLKAEHE